MSENTAVDVMIDLDCILDTRLPTVYAMHRPTVTKILSNDYYKKRVKDTFGDIPYSIFNNYYKNRNKNILKLATPTPMLNLLKEYCMAAVSLTEATKKQTIVTLYLNVHPYELNGDETIKIIELLYGLLPVRINIEIINKSNDKVTPKFICENISNLIKYDIITWLEYHSATGGLSKYPVLSTSCIGPLIANGKKSSKDITQSDFESLRELFGPFTNLILLQASLFSTN